MNCAELPTSFLDAELWVKDVVWSAALGIDWWLSLLVMARSAVCHRCHMEILSGGAAEIDWKDKHERSQQQREGEVLVIQIDENYENRIDVE